MRQPRTVFFSLSISIILVYFLLVAQHAHAAGTIFVTPNGGGNGSAWDNATTLQIALATAITGDEIWVKGGLYTPGAVVSDTFSLVAGVALYGGFAGNETQRSQRDWVVNPTILSGDIGGDDGTDANGVVRDPAKITGTNSQRVVTADGTRTAMTSTTIFDGFTITAGDAKNLSAGGFYCNGDVGECSPHLENVVFSANLAERGAAMYNDGFAGVSSPSLVNVIFSNNKGGWSTNDNEGGAMFNDAGNRGVSSPSLVNVIFVGNSVIGEWGRGGAMYNRGPSGGDSYPNLVNVIFVGNSADRNGGAMFNDDSSPSLVNVTFTGNSAGQDGGAIYNNSYRGSTNPSLVNVILWANTAITKGAQMYNFVASPTITTSIVQGGINGEGIFNYSKYSIVTDGGGNLDADPLFFNAANGDLRLKPTSPAIDTGTNSMITTSTDLDGSLRKIDGDGNGTVTVDMGAYEAQDSNSLIGSVQGQVIDDKGTGIVGAVVTLTRVSEDARVSQLTQTTDSKGDYVFEEVPIGDYSIIARINDSNPSAPISIIVLASQTTTIPAITMQSSESSSLLPLLYK